MANPENSGCKETEECIRVGDQNSECNCLIPINERVSASKCECAEGTFIEGHCVVICDTFNDCGEGKCVLLPNNKHKTCLCPIEKKSFVLS